jgi:hypothetical protein
MRIYLPPILVALLLIGAGRATAGNDRVYHGARR